MPIGITICAAAIPLLCWVLPDKLFCMLKTNRIQAVLFSLLLILAELLPALYINYAPIKPYAAILLLAVGAIWFNGLAAVSGGILCTLLMLLLLPAEAPVYIIIGIVTGCVSYFICAHGGRNLSGGLACIFIAIPMAELLFCAAEGFIDYGIEGISDAAAVGCAVYATLFLTAHGMMEKRKSTTANKIDSKKFN